MKRKDEPKDRDYAFDKPNKGLLTNIDEYLNCKYSYKESPHAPLIAFWRDGLCRQEEHRRKDTAHDIFGCDDFANQRHRA